MATSSPYPAKFAVFGMRTGCCSPVSLFTLLLMTLNCVPSKVAFPCVLVTSFVPFSSASAFWMIRDPVLKVCSITLVEIFLFAIVSDISAFPLFASYTPAPVADPSALTLKFPTNASFPVGSWYPNGAFVSVSV